MVKCPRCPKKFPTHHGLGGHLSGPCGLKGKVAMKNGESSKQKSVGNSRTKLKSAIQQRLETTVQMMRAVSREYKAKAQTLDFMAKSIEALK